MQVNDESSMRLVASVTGASGVIGRRIVKGLLCKNYKVKVLSRNHQYSYPENVNVYRGDLSDRKVLQELINGSDVLFHCAGELHDAENMWEVNVNGMELLLDVCRGSSLKSFCYISSAGVIGSSNSKFITELSKCNPRNIYEKSKYCAEQLALNFKSNISIVCLRPTNVVDDFSYGAIEFVAHGSFKNMCKALIKGRECAHLVHAMDVANAAIHLSSIAFEKPEIYFVSCDHDELNNYARIWSLFRSMENKKTFPGISPLFCMPLTMLHSVRSFAGRPTIKGDVRFSSEKLINTGFNYMISVNDIVSRMLKLKT